MNADKQDRLGPAAPAFACCPEQRIRRHVLAQSSQCGDLPAGVGGTGHAAVVLLLAAMVCLPTLSGCVQSGFTRQNFDTIHVGEAQDQVRRKLGPPRVAAADNWAWSQDDPTHYEARIWFKDGKVAKKEWFDRKEMFK